MTHGSPVKQAPYQRARQPSAARRDPRGPSPRSRRVAPRHDVTARRVDADTLSRRQATLAGMPGPSSVRERYLDHAQLTAQLRTWATQHPDFIRLRALTTTEGGRELWLLTIGPRPDEPRPALWVDANMHASELCGSNVALAVAEETIALHLDPDARPLGLPAHVCARLRSIHVHVAPRLSPDGAEVILKGETLVRSIPRDPLGYASTRPRWIPGTSTGTAACGRSGSSTRPASSASPRRSRA